MSTSINCEIVWQRSVILTFPIMRLFCLFLIVNVVDAQFSFYDLSRVNKDCRKSQFESEIKNLKYSLKFELLSEIFAIENPYEFGDPFRRAARLCKSVTKYVSFYNRGKKREQASLQAK